MALSEPTRRTTAARYSFELYHPVPANSVAAQCGENSIYVEVMEDFFGTGLLIMPSAFTLGGCTATGEDSSTQVLIFESELHGCGSTSLVRFDCIKIIGVLKSLQIIVLF